MLIIYYFLTTLIATYFLFALYIAFKSDLQGKRIGIGDALSQASKYRSQILGWTVFYTIVIVAVRLLESQMKGILAFVMREVAAIGLFLGMTFAIPIIFEDDVKPWEAVKRSATFIINNIGKTFSGIIYFDVIGFVIRIIGAICMAGAIFAGIIDILGMDVSIAGFTILGHTSFIAVGLVFAVGLAIYIIGALFNYVTLHIYYLVVYDYVKNGKVPEGMDETLIRSSISRAGMPSSGGLTGKGKEQKSTSGLFQTGDAPDLKDFVK